MNSALLCIALTSAILALIPSKAEDQWRVPWASIGLAINAGVMLYFAGR